MSACVGLAWRIRDPGDRIEFRRDAGVPRRTRPEVPGRLDRLRGTAALIVQALAAATLAGSSASQGSLFPPGADSIDFKAFAIGAAGGHPDAGLTVPGDTYQTQAWGRDAAPFATGLTSALSVTICL